MDNDWTYTDEDGTEWYPLDDDAYFDRREGTFTLPGSGGVLVKAWDTAPNDCPTFYMYTMEA